MQWCYGLKCLLSVGLSVRVAVAIPKVQTVVSCRPASILLADKKYVTVIAEMAISIVILIPVGDP